MSNACNGGCDCITDNGLINNFSNIATLDNDFGIFGSGRVIFRRWSCNPGQFSVGMTTGEDYVDIADEMANPDDPNLYRGECSCGWHGQSSSCNISMGSNGCLYGSQPVCMPDYCGYEEGQNEWADNFCGQATTFNACDAQHDHCQWYGGSDGCIYMPPTFDCGWDPTGQIRPLITCGGCYCSGGNPPVPDNFDYSPLN